MAQVVKLSRHPPTLAPHGIFNETGAIPKRGHPIFGGVDEWFHKAVDGKLSVVDSEFLLVIWYCTGSDVRHAHWLIPWSKSDCAVRNGGPLLSFHVWAESLKNEFSTTLMHFVMDQAPGPSILEIIVVLHLEVRWGSLWSIPDRSVCQGFERRLSSVNGFSISMVAREVHGY
ncbi:MAG: hypothetical protein ACK50P_06735 [Planctomycetaceae bacterium]|jgi:hypothetical protein